MSEQWSLALPTHGDGEQLDAWLQEQLRRCDEQAFGHTFAASCAVPGCPPEAYLHRLLEVDGETLLAGVRFKGGGSHQPFVDLLAWTGVPKPSWIPAISRDFSQFNPTVVRYCLPQGVGSPWPGEVDQYVVAGSAKGASHEWVAPASDLSWFQEYRSRFDEWQERSLLGPEVHPTEEGELESCLDVGHVVVARYGGRFVGVAACRLDSERSFKGWMIVEEFVVPEFHRRGLGVALQRGLMSRLQVGDLVWGTIHGKNKASLATAKRCGRDVVETWWFSRLEAGRR